MKVLAVPHLTPWFWFNGCNWPVLTHYQLKNVQYHRLRKLEKKPKIYRELGRYLNIAIPS